MRARRAQKTLGEAEARSPRRQDESRALKLERQTGELPLQGVRQTLRVEGERCKAGTRT